MAPSIVAVISELAASKRVAPLAPSGVPAAQPTHVNTRRASWLVAWIVRNRCAMPPFSTTSPSGASLALFGVPFGSFTQNALLSVQ